MNDTWSNRYIICPYCGCKHEDNIEEADIFYAEGNHKYECYDCEKAFRVNTEVEYVYESEELEE